MGALQQAHVAAAAHDPAGTLASLEKLSSLLLAADSADNVDGASVLELRWFLNEYAAKELLVSTAMDVVLRIMRLQCCPASASTEGAHLGRLEEEEERHEERSSEEQELLNAAVLD